MLSMQQFALKEQALAILAQLEPEALGYVYTTLSCRVLPKGELRSAVAKAAVEYMYPAKPR